MIDFNMLQDAYTRELKSRLSFIRRSKHRDIDRKEVALDTQPIVTSPPPDNWIEDTIDDTRL